MNYSINEGPQTEHNSSNSSKLFNVRLNSLQSISGKLRSISDGEMGDVRKNERRDKSPTYRQFDELENDFVDVSSTSFWVSLLCESINVNFQVNADFGGECEMGERMGEREKRTLSAFILIECKIVIGFCWNFHMKELK